MTSQPVQPIPGVAYMAQPGDARHGALLVLGDADRATGGLKQICDTFAEDGFETVLLQAAVDPQPLLATLRGPWLLLGFGAGAAAAWAAAGRVEGLAVAVLFDPDPLEAPDIARLCPVGVHIGGARSANIQALEAAQPDLPVHAYPAAPGFFLADGPAYDAASAHLARLRTLALFRRSISRGEA